MTSNLTLFASKLESCVHLLLLVTENVKRALTFSSSEEEGASRPPGGEAGRAGLLLYLGCDPFLKETLKTRRTFLL